VPALIDALKDLERATGGWKDLGVTVSYYAYNALSKIDPEAVRMTPQ
jgi:hypothetical protein